jgi:peptidoglycan/xylan/chitin deacetylase (PgdA/CDA1 family)
VRKVIAACIALLCIGAFMYAGSHTYREEYHAPILIDSKETSKDYGIDDDKHKGIAVLMYHHILRNHENRKFRNNAAVITPEKFEAQMKFLHDHGFHTIDLDTLEKYVDGKITLSNKNIVLTFDDGYESNYKYAYPILKKYHYVATIFAITGSISNSPEHWDPDKLNHISWPEIPKYADVFKIESHTHRFHRMLNGKGYLITQPLKLVKEDIATSKKLINASYFAYPYGQYNENTIRILKELGFKMAFTTKKGYVYPGCPKYEINRIAIYPYTSFRQFKHIVGM